MCPSGQKTWTAWTNNVYQSCIGQQHKLHVCIDLTASFKPHLFDETNTPWCKAWGLEINHFVLYGALVCAYETQMGLYLTVRVSLFMFRQSWTVGSQSQHLWRTGVFYSWRGDSGICLMKRHKWSALLSFPHFTFIVGHCRIAHFKQMLKREAKNRTPIYIPDAVYIFIMSRSELPSFDGDDYVASSSNILIVNLNIKQNIKNAAQLGHFKAYVSTFHAWHHFVQLHKI